MTSSSSKDVIQILLKDGWTVKRQRGSHVQLEHPTKKGKVTVPHPNKDLPQKTVQAIMKQANLDNIK
ncbi:MAG: type II toxin-antitoxin system HicA family toxin [Peptococcaceae bacterium]|nr:type II toxin-antitoxin system HicA family toxin [Peptococcaceae bacterium]